MTISRYDCWKRLSRRRKLENVGAETTCSGSPFRIRGPETLKVRLPTIDSPNIDTTRRLELAERNARVPADRADLPLGRVVQGTVALCRAEPCTSVRRSCIGCALALLSNVEHQWRGQSVFNVERSAVLPRSTPSADGAEDRLGCRLVRCCRSRAETVPAWQPASVEWPSEQIGGSG